MMDGKLIGNAERGRTTIRARRLNKYSTNYREDYQRPEDRPTASKH